MEQSGARWISGQVMGEDYLMILRAVIGREDGRGPPSTEPPRLSKFFLFLIVFFFLCLFFTTSQQQDRSRGPTRTRSFYSSCPAIYLYWVGM